VKNIEEFRKITDELRVLARSSPEDKYILATGLKQLGNVVAMTGDGTNDAPALKKADIGFAMGLAGTQVAKEAAGIILLDDNFSSIITAVKYGRNIFDCIRKFLQFQLTVNIVAIFMAFLGAVVIKESPLTPIQMLWVNLIMDTLAALALATEPPSNDLLNRMPYSRTEHIINSQMWRGIVLSSVYQIVVLVLVLFKGDQMFGVASSIGLTIEDWN
jgi:P-type Ca2+ transporter type 2B